MKRILFSALLALGCIAAQAETRAVIKDVAIDSASVTKPAQVAVDLVLDLSDVHVGYNRSVALTPILRNGDESAELPSVVLYGRNRWIQHERLGDYIISPDEIAMRASKAPETYDYSVIVPYQKWMNGSSLSLRRSEYGCVSCQIPGTVDELDDLASYAEKPVILYADYSDVAFVVPAAVGEKVRELSGKAYVDFPVNVTQIRPDYRNNQKELQRITATIDSVRTDPDVSVDALYIRGYASPEGTYALNEKLAKGRTEALAEYVRNLYNFPAGVVHTSWEAENWQGLRQFVKASTLPDKEAIIDIIDDSSLQPDAREWKIKSTYPEQYKILLAECYPALRVTDYRIEYTIRSYTDPAEIARIMQERPQNLSLNEFYLLAQTYEPGTPEFNDVFETAVRMYPNDEAANLNAANAALMRGDLVQAERYLARAGSSAEAQQARGVLSRLQALAAEQ